MRLRSILEMANLKSWYPTDKLYFLVYNKDYDYLGDVHAIDDEEAISVASKKYKVDPSEITIKELQGSAYFSRADIKSINSERTIKRIEDWLNNHSEKYEWIFHFISRGSLGDLEDITATPGVITFVKVGNSGGDVLTSHMILHTVGHAIVAANNKMYKSELTNDLYDLLKDVSDKIGDLQNIDSSAYKPYQKEREQIKVLCKFLHMKAAFFTLRDNFKGFPSFGEIANELAGIFVKNGRVKFYPNEYNDIDVDLQYIKGVENEINLLLKQFVDNCVGKIIVDR